MPAAPEGAILDLVGHHLIDEPMVLEAQARRLDHVVSRLEAAKDRLTDLESSIRMQGRELKELEAKIELLSSPAPQVVPM